MKFLDLLDEKIDYLFKRGKNADERCYDFFIRTITFFVVVLIVLCYGSFVHAENAISSDYVTIGDVFDYVQFFDSTDFNNYLSAADLTTNDISGYGILAGASYSRPSMDWIKSVKIPASISLNDVTFTPEQYIIVIRRGNIYSEGEQLIGIDIAVGDNIFIPNGSPNIITQFNNSGSEVMAVASANFHSYSDTPWGDGYTFQTINTLTDTFTNSFNYNYYSTNMNGQYYYFIGSSMGYTIDGLTDNEKNDFYYTYATYEDKRIQLNYQYVSNLPEPEPEVESNVNHLYLNDIQVGLTSSNNNQSLLASEVVIGIDVDDWILNNIDDYSLLVSYNINFKDTMVTNPNDPSGSTSVIVPLRSFYNNAYAYSVAEILRNISVSGIGTFLNYYNDLNSGGIDVVSVNTYNALLPSPLKELEYKLGQFWLNLFPESSTIDYSVFQFDLTVSAILVDHVSDEQSSPYIKEFDFVHGAESVKSAEILRNNNPWEGSQDPQQSPIVPSANGSVSNGSGGGNVSVTVNNNGNQKIPLNVHTKKELDDVINNYGYVQERLFSTFNELTDETKEDGYLNLLKQTLPEISNEVPVIDFFIKCAIVSIALSLIIFVLKVFLF